MKNIKCVKDAMRRMKQRMSGGRGWRSVAAVAKNGMNMSSMRGRNGDRRVGSSTSSDSGNGGNGNSSKLEPLLLSSHSGMPLGNNNTSHGMDMAAASALPHDIPSDSPLTDTDDGGIHESQMLVRKPNEAALTSHSAASSASSASSVMSKSSDV